MRKSYFKLTFYFLALFVAVSSCTNTNSGNSDSEKAAILTPQDNASFNRSCEVIIANSKITGSKAMFQMIEQFKKLDIENCSNCTVEFNQEFKPVLELLHESGEILSQKEKEEKEGKTLKDAAYKKDLETYKGLQNRIRESFAKMKELAK